MRNLILLNQFHFSLDSPLGNISGFTEVDENKLYYFVTQQGVLFGIDIKAGKITSKVDLKNTEEDVITKDAKIVGIRYVAEIEALCIATDTGDIITLDPRSKEIEVVGSIQEGITCMSWSPDQELVIFATGNNTLMTMNKDWDIITENPISKDLKDDKRIVPEICWRGDGNYYAVNALDNDGKRWIWVWERTGKLFSKTKISEGLGDKVYWRPDGSIIASSFYAKEKDETTIIFFEKNGLQHYDFLLEKGKSDVKAIAWNSTSDILCVMFVPHGQKNPIIQLWHRNNYHWYLKQEFISFLDSSPSFVTWDRDSPYRLHVFCEDGKYWCNDFCWDVCMSTEMTPENPCTVTVIDGKKLLFTPFRFAVTPPPMSVETASFEFPVNYVYCGAKGKMLVKLSDGTLQLVDVPHNNKPPKFGIEPKVVATLKDKTLKHLRLLTLISDNVFYAVEPTKSGEGDILVSATFNDSKIESIKRFTYPEKIIRIAINKEKVFVQTESGALYTQASTEFKKWIHAFGGPCTHFAVCTFNGEETCVGLTDRGVLYINGNVASSDCSSFALHNQFLLFTTYSHNLRLIDLDLTVDAALDLAASQPHSQFDYTFRSIERGARLVAVVPHDIRVVLQMPRGNLEGIFPRALVLAHMRNLLDNYDYKKAIEVARKYKVDMNLLYDHDPKAFLEHAEDFVKKVDNSDNIELFLTALINEDITQTLYKNYPVKNKQTPEGVAQKVNTVCKALRSALKKVDERKFITSIITTYVQQQPPDLESALMSIRAMRVEELKGEPISGKPPSEKALDYLILISNVNKLYDIALGMYDFELVMMIAQKSQKDPKEYLPFLSKLQQMETHYQRYTIDMHLERYESALKNLAQAGDKYYEESKKLIKERELYKLGIALFEKDGTKKDITAMYADYLKSQGKHKQAAYAYIDCNNLEQAQEALVQIGEYRLALTIAKQLKQSPQQIKLLAEKLVDTLKDQGQIKEAALLMKDFLNDCEGAVVILVEADYFFDAIHLATLCNRADLIKTNIQPGVYDAYEKQIEELDETSTKLQKYINRLIELRKEKREQALREAEEEDLMGNVDAFSDTGSIQSGMSVYSGVSVYSHVSKSKAKRRIKSAARQKTKLRKGSPYEEDQLVIRIGQLIPSASYQTTIGELIQALIYFKELSKAKTIQQKLQKLIDYSIEHKDVYEQTYTPPSDSENVPAPKTPKKIAEILGNVNWKLDILE